jgi:predicted transcriptional regulator
MTTITIRLSEEEKQKIAEYAEKNDLSMSQVIRKSLKEFFEEKEE